MTAKQLFILGASMLAAALAGGAVVQQGDEQYVQVAEIEVDPVLLDAYRTAVQEQIDAAIRKEPGVLVLYAVSEKATPPTSRSSRSTGTGAPTKLTSARIISRNTRRRWRRW